MTHTFDMSKYLGILKAQGEFHMVGLPDEPLPEMMAQLFAANGPKLTGSHLGNHQEMDALLKLAAEKGVKPWVETIDISEAGCKEAVERLKDNKVRYRFTLTGFDKAFGRA
jgi:alcohol dehydrogenase (NADP+)